MTLFSLRTLAGFSFAETALLLAVWLLGGYCFAISMPTVVNRSLSFYLLEKLQQFGGGIRTDLFSDITTKNCMAEDRQGDVRLTEQLESGTISIASRWSA